MSSKPKRTRTGCLCCRRRHKKCDEAKPACGFCVSKGIQCEWPVKGAVFVNYGHSNKDPLQTVSLPTPTKTAFDPPTPVVNVSAPPISMMTSFSITTTDAFYRFPPSKAKSTTSESSLSERSMSMPSPRQRASSISSLPCNVAVSPQSTAEPEYDYSINTLALPPLKPYHFVPRAVLLSTRPVERVLPPVAPNKRLSVDSLLN